MNRSNTTHAAVICHSTSVTARRALTLIEMLIGMAITLLMMAAIVNLFANISSGVKIRRATMEMSSELRIARATLFNDLAGATCRALPWQRPDEDPGYLEIIDGSWSDWEPSILTDGIDDPNNGELNYATSLVPSAGDPAVFPPAGPAVPNAITNGRGLGDHDCILALTVQSETAPFQGTLPVWNSATNRWDPSTIESNFAEVIWYVVENPASGSLGEPGMRTLYRRVLLIAPWVSDLPPVTGAASAQKNVSRDIEYYRLSDISFRHDGDLRIPNTLGDLAKRENRFAHRRNLDGSGGGLGWPYIMDQFVIRLFPIDIVSPLINRDSPLRPFGAPFQPDLLTIDDHLTYLPDRLGEDVMLTNVLAFDLRVFDPGAPLVEVGGAVLGPDDGGWNPALGPIVGYGDYVSLGWSPAYSDPGLPRANYVPPTGAPTPLFREPHTPGWHPSDPNNALTRNYWATYDTWSFHYEHDGINQDQDFLDAGATPSIDEGTNGLDDRDPTGGGDPLWVDHVDDIAVNGVDDIFERETSPPYPVPLRGMQVKLRIYEPETRQIREATVTRSFVPQ